MNDAMIFMDKNGRTRTVQKTDVERIKKTVEDIFGMNVINYGIYPKHGDDWCMNFLLFRNLPYPLKWHAFWVNYRDGIFACDGYKFGVDPLDMWKIHEDGDDWHGYLKKVDKELNEIFSHSERIVHESSSNIRAIDMMEEYLGEIEHTRNCGNE